MHLKSADQVQHREWALIMGVCGSISLSSFKRQRGGFQHRSSMWPPDPATRCLPWPSQSFLVRILHCRGEEKRQRENMSDSTLKIYIKTKANWLNMQADLLYSVPVMWARARKDLDCRWAALLVHSAGPSSLVSLGMTAWYTGEALSITRSLTGRLLQPQKEPVVWKHTLSYQHDQNVSKGIFMFNDIKCIFLLS